MDLSRDTGVRPQRDWEKAVKEGSLTLITVHYLAPNLSKSP